MRKKTHAHKGIIPNVAKLPLTEYWAQLPNAKRNPKSAPKEELLRAISIATSRHPGSCRQWFLGVHVPSNIVLEKIAEILQCPVECLIKN